jgi:voltage-gated potassium channel Kch
VNRLGSVWRDLRIVLRSVWVNLALFATVILGAAALLKTSGSFRSLAYGDLIVKAFHMAYLESVAEPGSGVVPAVLTFVVPLLTVTVLGEGALRVFSVYVRRDQHREEWDRLVAKAFSEHTVICGVGELGRAICQHLLQSSEQAQIVLVDTRPDILAELQLLGRNVCHLQMDMTSEAALQAANCAEASLIILASGNDAFNLEAGFKAYALNPEAEIWIRLYRGSLASLLDLSTKPHVHFFSPYERAAEALMEHLTP